jgi:hypothetical protein
VVIPECSNADLNVCVTQVKAGLFNVANAKHIEYLKCIGLQIINVDQGEAWLVSLFVLPGIRSNL